LAFSTTGICIPFTSKTGTTCDECESNISKAGDHVPDAVQHSILFDRVCTSWLETVRAPIMDSTRINNEELLCHEVQHRRRWVVAVVHMRGVTACLRWVSAVVVSRPEVRHRLSSSTVKSEARNWYLRVTCT